jgi:hypothetical protein
LALFFLTDNSLLRGELNWRFWCGFSHKKRQFDESDAVTCYALAS